MKLSMQFDIFLYSEYRTEQAVIYWCIKLMLNCRVSPERLFLDLALGKSDASITDNLGISLGLDINTLYELSAENCVQNHSYERAIKLFKMAKVIAIFTNEYIHMSTSNYIKSMETWILNHIKI